MKLVRNTGTDRVIDLVRPGLTPGSMLDIVTSTFSLFAFAEMIREADQLVRCRLVLPPAAAELEFLGTAADRAARNRLQSRWLAQRAIAWIQDKTEVRQALGQVPQGAFVLRDGNAQPRQVLLGRATRRPDDRNLCPAGYRRTG